MTPSFELAKLSYIETSSCIGWTLIKNYVIWLFRLHLLSLQTDRWSLSDLYYFLCLEVLELCEEVQQDGQEPLSVDVGDALHLQLHVHVVVSC